MPQLRFGSGAAVDVDEDEVVYIAREMWRGRSARDQAAQDVGRGMYRAMAYMCLTRCARWQRLPNAFSASALCGDRQLTVVIGSIRRVT